jgi:hypothetical protein
VTATRTQRGSSSNGSCVSLSRDRADRASPIPAR